MMERVPHARTHEVIALGNSNALTYLVDGHGNRLMSGVMHRIDAREIVKRFNAYTGENGVQEAEPAVPATDWESACLRRWVRKPDSGNWVRRLNGHRLLITKERTAPGEHKWFGMMDGNYVNEGLGFTEYRMCRSGFQRAAFKALKEQ